MKTHGLSLLAFAGAALGGSLLSYLVLDNGLVGARGASPSPTISSAHAPAIPACGFDIKRVSGFHRVGPLLSTESACESPRLSGLRSSITTMMEGLRASGQLSSASVYVRDFHTDEWTWYNGNMEYDPGSLLKLPLLITYLSMAEDDPDLLQRTWTCEPMDFNVPQHTAFPSEQARLNVSYSVEQLLELAISHSDNRATVMLMRRVKVDRYIRAYTELGLPAPDMQGKSYRMNVRDYSVFMKALFNSAILGPLGSEYALELMTRADFVRGLSAGLPPGIEIAHKFGEAGTDQERQLHETGLVYAKGNPYLITVMTSGPNVDTLASAIASVSKLVYERMSTP